MAGHRRRAGKVVLAVEDERLGGVGLVEGGHLAEGGGMGDFLQVVGGQDAAAGLAIVHPVDLGAAQAQQLGQAVGGIAQAAEVALVHHAAPVGDHHRAALLRKITDGAGELLPQQIGHR